ncbi:hypothetical protein, partial [uncultured Maribacter sp.]|uniref:beta strand repeat-containing protein n=1 Tax=uncultured Maribacter sp. TaxID=431308 RepID=UPI0026150144
NLDGTYTFTDASGTDVIISDTSISTLSTPVNGVYTYTDEAGNTQTIDTNASSNPYDNSTSLLTATNVQDAIDEIVNNSSDNQQISSSVITANETLNIVLERGGNTNIDIRDADSDITNELTVVGNGAPVAAPANNNIGATYVDESAGQLYVWDGSAWDVVGGSATPIADIVTTLVDHGDGSFTYTNENNDDVIFRASTISDNGNGTSTITTADGDTLIVDNDGVDNDTQYTAGNGLNLDVSNVFTAVASPDANNALDVRANGIYATDTNTEYTAGDGLDLSGTEFTANISGNAGNALSIVGGELYATDTDDQDAGEVTFDDSTANLGETDVQGAIEALASATDNDTQYTAGNGLNLDVSNEFTAVASPDANNALDVRANGIYATDDQNAGEVSVNPAGNITSTNVQSALEELDASITSSELTTTVVEGTGIDVTPSVTGNNTEYTVSFEEAAIADGNITSGDNTIDVTGGDDSVFTDVVLDVRDNAITNAKLANNAVQTENIVNGTILAEDVSSGGNDKVLVTNPAGVVEWIDKSALVPATTVSNTSSGNALSTTVDGVTGANVSIINSNTLTLNGSDELVSTVNGVDSNAIDLSDYRETVVGTGDIGVTDDGNGNYTVNYVDGDSDDENEIQDLNYDASTQTLNITNNGSATNIDLSGLNDSGTDNQAIDNLSIVDGELNLSLERDGVLPSTVDLISSGANNDITFGADGGLYLNVASVTISETNTTLGFNGTTNELTFTNELGNNPVLNLSSINTDNQEVDTFSFNAATGDLTLEVQDDGQAA